MGQFKNKITEGSMFPMWYRLGGVEIERPPQMREVTGSIPSRVIPNTSNIAVMAALRAQSCRLSITTGWCQKNRQVLVTYSGHAVILLNNC